jgi:hypothetical protein
VTRHIGGRSSNRNLRTRHAVVTGPNLSRSYAIIQGVPLATDPCISLTILPLMRILQRNFKRTTDTFLFISHTTNVPMFKFRCNIFIGVGIIKEMPGSVESGTQCTKTNWSVLNSYTTVARSPGRWPYEAIYFGVYRKFVQELRVFKLWRRKCACKSKPD